MPVTNGEVALCVLLASLVDAASLSCSVSQHPKIPNASSGFVLGCWFVQGRKDSCDQVFPGEIGPIKMPLDVRAEWSC